MSETMMSRRPDRTRIRERINRSLEAAMEEAGALAMSRLKRTTVG